MESHPRLYSMPKSAHKYLVFWWRLGTVLMMFVVANNGELHHGAGDLLENDSRTNPAYLNPDLYREGIASLVNAKERAEELMYKNDIIARLVTEMPYHEIQNRLLISGNHKEVNRTFFENLNLKDAKSGNCGRFDVFRLLTMVQRSREQAMLETTVPDCVADSSFDGNYMVAKNADNEETSTEMIRAEESTNATANDQSFDWAQFAEASKQLLEQRAKAANREASLISTVAPPLQDIGQQLPTLLKFPLLKNQPQNDVSSILLTRLGETLNIPREKLIGAGTQTLAEALFPAKNQLPQQYDPSGIDTMQFGPALHSYSRDVNDIPNARNFLLRNRINS